MRLVVHGHDVEVTPEVHSHVERRLLPALQTFGKRVGRVTIRLHGAEDGVATCHILVELHPSGGLGVGEAASNPATAIDRAAQRAHDVVARELARRRGLPDARSLAFGLE